MRDGSSCCVGVHRVLAVTEHNAVRNGHTCLPPPREMVALRASALAGARKTMCVVPLGGSREPIVSREEGH
jgi:hypothetical protein